jgi:hypothetical protein
VRPTASCFEKFITPARCEYSKQATRYACEIVARRMKLFTVEDLPSKWMEHGNDMEPNAVHAYEKQFGVTTHKAGFVLTDFTDDFGGSPDRLIGLVQRDDDHWDCEGVLEIKCVKAETLMDMHLNEGSAELYAKPQVQGLLWITKAQWLDFYVFHPELEPFHQRVLPDEEYQAKIAEHLLTFLAEIKRVEASVKRKRHEIVSVPTVKSDVKWSD